MTSNGQFVHKLSSFLFLLPIESLRLHVRTGICLKNSSIIGDELSAAHKKLRIQFRKSFNKTKCYECTHCSRTFNLERVLNKHFSKEHEQENCEICPNCGKKVVHLDIHLENCDKDVHSEEVRNSVAYCIIYHPNIPIQASQQFSKSGDTGLLCALFLSYVRCIHSM